MLGVGEKSSCRVFSSGGIEVQLVLTVGVFENLKCRTVAAVNNYVEDEVGWAATRTHARTRSHTHTCTHNINK